MVSRVLTGAVVSAAVGATMLAISMGPASAFTLSAPSLENKVATSSIEQIWWHHGGWHRSWGWRRGWGYRPWGWGWHGGWGYRPWGWGWHRRHCWVNRWGGVSCGW
jgi:hypothetical protein